jgi:hypothetical protein
MIPTVTLTSAWSRLAVLGGKGNACWTNLERDLQGCPSLTSLTRAKECHEHFADGERERQGNDDGFMSDARP